MSEAAEDDRTRARAFAQHVLNQLFAFSSEDFQRSVWIQGDHPEHYVQDYVEAMEVLRDFIPLLTEDRWYRLVPLSDEQFEALHRFDDLIERFDACLPVRDAEHALADPQWPSIRAAAARTLHILEEGKHGLRHLAV
jgi:hypothetical protein